MLEPLLDVQLAKTFARKHNLINIEEVFNGKVIIINVPRSRYERAAQAVYTLAKRRFFTEVENRRSNPHVDQQRPVLFAVDEYQLCISETDVLSLGIVLSAGCMVFATSQGVSSLYSVLPKNYVDAALQNFTQKIFFKSDDLATLAAIDSASRRVSRSTGITQTTSYEPRPGALPAHRRRHLQQHDPHHAQALRGRSLRQHKRLTRNSARAAGRLKK